MAIFKCKMCGGALEINNNETVATCEYCGTKQTLPKLDDEKKANLFDRANHFRRNNEFDKAMGIYEQILNEDNTDSEAYWSLVLCRYGIEYVEDPSSHKRIPTVNRAQFTSIFDDDNYKSALEYADALQKSVYEEEAKAINEIQKGILAISQKEDPFDVFICYKESDNNGRRTPDSVLANDLYHQLTQEGFKVFFARITLEDKLGSAYEPYIFAALNSSKVMVVLGTKPEFFNAVWVKNEWSRYLALIKNGEKKMLIPAYKDMDPYDLPEEFSHLQAQDMSKLGFMQDLIRGIKKIVEADEPKTATVVKETVVTTSVNADTAPLLKRAFMFLEDGDWKSADEYCEKVLDIDPECADAYLGKLMAELRVNRKDDLKDCAQPFDDRNNFEKIMRFGDESLKKELLGYISNFSSDSVDDYEDTISLLKQIPGWKDAGELIIKCNNRVEEIKAKQEADRLEKERLEAIAKAEAEARAKRNKKIAMIVTPIICVLIAFWILWTNVIMPNTEYNKALGLMEEGNVVEAYEALVALESYKDSAEKADSIYTEYMVEKLKVAKVGDYVFFGTYEHDNNTSNGKEDIEWLVLEVKDGKVLVISKYALDCKPYNTRYTGVTWETCTLRKWLNNDFINSAFSAKEKAMIPKVTISADTNHDHSIKPGNATQDQVFLLSITEANKYFSFDSTRQCKPTDYAVANGTYVNSGNSNCWWWLRSPGYNRNYAAVVNYDGGVSEYSVKVSKDEGAVRPALWIDLEAY